MEDLAWPPPDLPQDLAEKLERRLGRLHARQRLGLERELERHIFRRRGKFLHLENWYPSGHIMRAVLMMTGLYWRGLRNAENVQVRHNEVWLRGLPEPFDGFTILHLSDLHVDISQKAMQRLLGLLPGLRYDICVLTGDIRGNTFGPFDAALDGLARLCARIDARIYGVLGNHDTVCMVPGMEGLGIRMLMNESETIAREDSRIHLVGIDDAHYYQSDNIEKAASIIPHEEFSILLSHTPEVYRHAAHSDFDLMLSGHTHGGQICLPGSVPITLDAVLPRHMGSGAWTFHRMAGYTSAGAGTVIVPVRLNCLPEITLHRLRRA